jgi:hypothetical protein
MKHVRKAVDDPKVATHSLRHNMKDWLREARATKQQQDDILGHSAGGEGENYGGDMARLRVSWEVLQRVHQQSTRED